MRAPIRTALIVGIVTATVAILLSGCGSAGEQTPAGSSASRTSTTSPRAPTSPPSTHPTATTTPSTVPGEIRGTATDFCSAFANFSTGTTASKTFPDFLNVLTYAIADIRRFAPPSLEQPVEHFTDGLVGVSKDIQLLSIMTNADLAAAMQKVFTSPDGVTIAHYLDATCKH